MAAEEERTEITELERNPFAPSQRLDPKAQLSSITLAGLHKKTTTDT